MNDAQSASTDVDRPGAADGSRPQIRRLRHRPSTIVLLVLVVCLAVTSGFLGWKLADTSERLDRGRTNAQATREAAAAARDFAELVATYTPSSLDADFDQVLDHTTGQFRKEYESASSTLRESITRLEGRSTAKVHEVGVVSASASRAEVIVFLDQIVSNAELRKPRTDRARMKLVLTRTGDRWLVSNLSLV